VWLGGEPLPGVAEAIARFHQTKQVSLVPGVIAVD
jgi:hypothetical protein